MRAMRAGTGWETPVDWSVAVRAESGRVVVVVAGEMETSTAPALRELFVELVNAGHYHLVVDLAEVRLMDSTGLGVLVGGLKRVQAHGGSMSLVCTEERILKVFRITGLAKVFPIHATLTEALTEAPTAPGRRKEPSPRPEVPRRPWT